MNILISQILKAGRVDPKFYKSLKDTNTSRIPLGSIAEIVVGSTPKVRTKGKVPFYRVEDISMFRISTPRNYIEMPNSNNISICQKGDILMTIKGRVGDYAIVKENGTHNQDIARLRPKEIDIFTLLYILNSKSTKKEIEKFQTNQMHPYIRISDLKNIQIDTPDKNEVKNFKSSYDSLERFDSKISEINKKIHSYFKDSLKKDRNEITYSELINSGRLDAEHFVNVKSSEDIEVKDLKRLKIRIGNYTKKYVNSGIPYLRSADFKNGFIIYRKFVEGRYLLTQKGEILISRVGNIKILYIENEKLVPSDNFIRLTYDDKRIDQLVLSEYLNSYAGQDNLKKLLQGSKQKRINKSTLYNLQIPIIEKKTSEVIVKLIKKKRRLGVRYQSILSELLEQPK